jgi:hypothetical protein
MEEDGGISVVSAVTMSGAHFMPPYQNMTGNRVKTVCTVETVNTTNDDSITYDSGPEDSSPISIAVLAAGDT